MNTNPNIPPDADSTDTDSTDSTDLDRTCHPLLTRAAAIGLRPITAYVSESVVDGGRKSSGDSRKLKDQIRRKGERQIRGSNGERQFNRFVSVKNYSKLSLLVERLETSSDWDSAIRTDPAIVDKVTDLEARLAASNAAEKESDRMFKNSVALGAAQQLELAELKPLAERAKQAIARIDEYEFAMNELTRIYKLQGIRKLLLWLAGVHPPHDQPYL